MDALTATRAAYIVELAEQLAKYHDEHEAAEENEREAAVAAVRASEALREYAGELVKT